MQYEHATNETYSAMASVPNVSNPASGMIPNNEIAKTACTIAGMREKYARKEMGTYRVLLDMSIVQRPGDRIADEEDIDPAVREHGPEALLPSRSFALHRPRRLESACLTSVSDRGRTRVSAGRMKRLFVSLRENGGGRLVLSGTWWDDEAVLGRVNEGRSPGKMPSAAVGSTMGSGDVETLWPPSGGWPCFTCKKSLLAIQ